LPRYSETPVKDIYVDGPNGRLFARVWGDLQAGAVPIILLHDSLGSVELWRDFPARLAEVTGHPVAAYDRLGFGRSDLYPGTLGKDFVQNEAHSGLAVIRVGLGLDRMILFGHSVGGGMAVAAGAAFPDTIAAVITESAQAFVEDRTLAGIREAEAGFEAPGQMERLARYHGDKARWVLDAWTKSWLSPAFADWTLDDDLRGLRCPLLAMHGDRDEYGSRLHPERIAGLPPNGGKAVIFEDCGHVPHREIPDRVLLTVGAFLGKPERRSV
jgi:pimeloyl-ACP methyl ester carboxylesterase